MSEVGSKWPNVLTDGLLRSFAYIVGVEQLKMFVSKAGEAIMAQVEDNGGTPPSGSNVIDIIKSTGESIKSLKPGDLDWSVESTEKGAKLSVKTCPFSELCSGMIGEIISGGRLEKKQLPCIMAELSAGSCRMLDNKVRATLDSFSPGNLCVTNINKSEV